MFVGHLGLALVHYPWTHSLVMSLAWAAAFGLAYALATGYRHGAWVVAGLVASHWFLDALTHRPDLPIVPGGDARVGLGLWNHVVATAVVEGAIFAAGVLLYATATRPRGRAGSIVLWSLVAFLVGTAAANQLSVPPGEGVIAWAGLSMWLLVAWMAWADRLRQPRPPEGGASGAFSSSGEETR